MEIWWISMRTSVVYKLFDKKSSGIGGESEIKYNQQLAEELHESIVRKLKKTKSKYCLLTTIFGVLILQVCN